MKPIRAIHLRNDVPVDVGEQETQPINLDALRSATAFMSYLTQYELEPLRVALVAGVRYMTVWNIRQGNPVRKDHAVLVRIGLQKLTGVGYTAPIAVLGQEERKT